MNAALWVLLFVIVALLGLYLLVRRAEAERDRKARERKAVARRKAKKEPMSAVSGDPSERFLFTEGNAATIEDVYAREIAALVEIPAPEHRGDVEVSAYVPSTMGELHEQVAQLRSDLAGERARMANLRAQVADISATVERERALIRTDVELLVDEVNELRRRQSISIVEPILEALQRRGRPMMESELADAVDLDPEGDEFRTRVVRGIVCGMVDESETIAGVRLLSLI